MVLGQNPPFSVHVGMVLVMYIHTYNVQPRFQVSQIFSMLSKKFEEPGNESRISTPSKLTLSNFPVKEAIDSPRSFVCLIILSQSWKPRLQLHLCTFVFIHVLVVLVFLSHNLMGSHTRK